MDNLKEKSLKYHQEKTPGKIKIVPTKPCTTADELSLAYTPGVAYPCLEIQRNPDDVYTYTARGNLVAVISNGTAVLGLGNIGALAGKPVMEGKGVLFKRFAGIDVFDLEINETNPQKFIDIVSALEPTFGGINLEDIKAPDCFLIEEELNKRLSIPVFHDDQHGTAIITAAALLNALELAKKKIDDAKIVFSGAGAAAIACAKLLLELGAKRDHIYLFDSEGLVTSSRKNLNQYKALFMQKKDQSLTYALEKADVFIGVSKGDVLTIDMIAGMNSPPIIFAMANPFPEIKYEVAKKAFPHAIIATGRSDYPNQVNNVLGFPFIFRGALDVRASSINLPMKLAAVKALMDLAHLPVPKEVTKAYGRKFSFGDEYIIPKPFDPRVLYSVAPAVAKAALDSGVARRQIDLEEYTQQLRTLAAHLAEGKF